MTSTPVTCKFVQRHTSRANRESKVMNLTYKTILIFYSDVIGYEMLFDKSFSPMFRYKTTHMQKKQF